MEGGATSFPRWANAETDAELRVEPVPGKAVLFYSQLPDVSRVELISILSLCDFAVVAPDSVSQHIILNTPISSLYPQGNLDDFSLHAAQPVTKGEKWLINLWTWSPLYE